MAPARKPRASSKLPAGSDTSRPTTGKGKEADRGLTKKTTKPPTGGAAKKIKTDTGEAADKKKKEPLISARPPGQPRIILPDPSQEVHNDILEIVRSRIPADISQKGLDPTRPPIHNLKDIFDDISRRAMDLGFGNVLSHLGSKKLRVVTMCSGTESPLLALEMVGHSLKRIYGLEFSFEHLFSAEIVPFKQAYIERNFHPPFIFRDVREMENPEAVTAYGSLQKVPEDPDILIAGASCVDFSNLNNLKKTLTEKGESGTTFFGILNYANVYRPALVVLENVKGAPWEQAKEAWKKIGYLATSVGVDTKDYYLPQTRERGYMVCIDQKREGCESLAENVGVEWHSLMGKFERQASSSASMFILEDDDPRLERIQKDMADRSGNSRSRVANWSRYQARHQSYRLNNKLGYKRPLSKFQDHGTCNMPDFVWQEWSRVQPERIWDTLDMNFLRTLRSNRYDINYKERFLELSQGIDREIDTRQFGILGCITPCGIPYVSTRGGPLCGLESLALQGLPLDRLLLTRESQRDLQDLAGNAMSSTVVGVAVLSALISGYRALERGTESATPQCEAFTNMIAPDNSHRMVERILDLCKVTNTDVPEILSEAKRSSRLCCCEGQSSVKRKGILECSLCGHTSCIACSGNPSHEYHAISNSTLADRINPVEFANILRNMIPMRLILSGMSLDDYDDLKGELDCSPKIWDGFLNSVGRALGDELRFSSVKRSEVWTVIYDGNSSSLHLVIHEDKVEWLLFVKPMQEEPAICINREIFGKPIARMRTTFGSLLEGQWKVCSPVSSKCTLDISGAGTKVPAYESKIGLQDDHFFEAKVWNHLVVSGPDAAVEDLETDVRGSYELLQECGTACAALHKRSSLDGTPVIYLFLDPRRLGDPELDSFVFSLTHERLTGHSHRRVIAELSHKWRASEAEEQGSTVDLFYRKWANCSKAKLQVFDDSGIISYRTLSPITTLTLGNIKCDNANVTLLEFSIPASAVQSWKAGPWQPINLMESSAFLSDFSWLIQRVIGFSDFEEWSLVASQIPDNIETICSLCAPKRPSMIWGLGRRGMIVPYEDPFEAASYERYIKARPPAFMAFTRVDEGNIGHLQIALNVNTLLHQAYDKLLGSTIDRDVAFHWRLLSNAPDIKDIGSKKFALTSNKGSPECQQPPNFRLFQLRPEQLRSLAWMISQEEEDIEPFEEEEVEEALLPFMMWRAEGKATVPKIVRGGILADEVGYGKTAVTLGLIDSQFSKDKLRMKKDAENADGVIPLKATLIVVPNIMLKQWETEITKFLKKTYNVLIISTAVSLKSKTIEAFQNADIVLMSWSVFNGASYYSRVEQFAAVPTPPLKDGRIFSEWFEETLGNIAEHVNLLRDDGPQALLDEIAVKRAYIKETEAYYTYVPSKRLKGKQLAEALEEEEQAKADTATEGDESASGEKRKLSAVQKGKRPQKKEKEKIWDDAKDFAVKSADQSWNTIKNPLLHMFEFNRIVIDEFTYVNEKKLTPLLTLRTRSRWVLSGTPPLNGFADVKSIAPFLGVNLGIDEDEPSKPQSARLAAMRRERSRVEQFLSFKNPHSHAWHEHRHQLAQKFLDRFMRQNVAEIDEIPWTEHFCLMKLSAAETAIYLELYMQLMSQDLQLRRNGSGRFNNDQVARINKLIGSSKSAQEALLKRCSSFVSETHSENIMYPAITCDDLLETRKQQLQELIEDLQFKLKLGAWLYSLSQSDDPKNYFNDFLSNVSEHNFGDQDVTTELQPLIDAAIRDCDPDDWNLFFASAEEIEAMKLRAKNKNKTEREQVDDEIDPDAEQSETESTEGADFDDEQSDNGDASVCGRETGDGEFSDDTDGEENAECGPSTKKVKLAQDATEKPSDVTEGPKKDLSWPLKPEAKDIEPTLRDVANTLRNIVREWVFRQRALRFLGSVRAVQANDKLPPCSVCESEMDNPAELHVLGHCGHICCDTCVESVIENEECLIKHCRGSGKRYRVIKASSLGRADEADKLSYGGSKFDAIIKLLSDTSQIPEDDRVILFVQYPEMLKVADKALELAGITHITIGQTDRGAARKVAEFQGTTINMDKIKVLILNMGGETAAGLNMQCANHVIFLSPMLAVSQYDYDSAMTQAIGRSRRYGQKKHVHIYHFLAGATIDVNILQHRREKILVKRGEEFALVEEDEVVGSDVGGWEGLSLGESVV